MSWEAAKPRRDLPDGHFDVLVIGSGMGGLTSALLLAKEGFKVCVVEQHYRPGGCLHRFFRKRVPFDTGFHYLGGVEQGGSFGKYLRFLGVRDQLHFHPLDPDGFDVLKLPGYEFRVPAGWGPLVARLKSEFPRETAAIDTFARICQQICAESFAYSFQRPPETSGEYTELTLGSLLDKLEVSNELRAVLSVQGFLYGVPPRETPIELHALVLDSMLQGPASLDGGGDALAAVMVEAIKQHGGEVRTRTRVSSLELKDGKVHRANIQLMKSSGTVEGEPIYADTFISNAHPHLTLDLLPPGALRPAYVSRVREMKNSISCIAGYYVSTATEAQAAKRPYNMYCVSNWDVESMYQAQSFSDNEANECLFLTFPGDREGRWDGPRLVLSLGLMPWSQVERYSGTLTGKRGEEYEAFKQREGAAMFRAVEQCLPDHAGHLEQIEVSTPLSNRDYAGAVEGGIYGLRHGMEAWGRYSLRSKTKIENLHLTGHSVLMPGIVGVTIGAFVTCSYLLGFEALFDRVAKS